MKNKFVLWILVLFIFMSVPFSYGEKKEGKSGAFDFVESIPGDSARDVELDGQIKLLFNKNVVNFTVKDNNEKCFSIKDEKGKEIPINIIFADDQIEPDKKREIILSPRGQFSENTTYTIHISPELKAKNGDSLERDVSISFTTLSLKPKEDSPPPEDKSKDKPVVKETEKPASTVPVQKQEEVTDDKDKKEDDIVQDENDTDVSSDEVEDINKGTDLPEEKGSDLESDADLDNAEDSTEEGKGSNIFSNKYTWITILAVALVALFVIKRKV